jgi:hypothetical protein
MKNEKLEFLSDEVRKGNPIGLREAMEVVEYQSGLQNMRKARSERRERILKSLAAVACSAAGGMVLVLGEIDDSPGLGGIGLILIATCMYLNSKLVSGK